MTEVPKNLNEQHPRSAKNACEEAFVRAYAKALKSETHKYVDIDPLYGNEVIRLLIADSPYNAYIYRPAVDSSHESIDFWLRLSPKLITGERDTTEVVVLKTDPERFYESVEDFMMPLDQVDQEELLNRISRGSPSRLK